MQTRQQISGGILHLNGSICYFESMEVNTASAIEPISPIAQASQDTPLSSETPQRNFLSKRMIIVGIVTVLITIAAATVFLSGDRSLPASVSEELTSEQVKTLSPAEVKFESFVNKFGNLNLPARVVSYKIKNNFSDEEAQEFGGKLGLSELKASSNGNLILSNLIDPQERGMMTFNKTSGAFEYESFGDFKPSSFGNSPVANALSLLRSLNLMDETVACDYTYNRKDAQFLNFVECHRDLSKVGGPIIDLVGSLNLSESASLTNVKVGLTNENSADDPQVINLNQGLNGKARPNDFNTITFGFYKDGGVRRISSNLRWLSQKSQFPKADLYSPEEALAKFSGQQATFSLTIPAGIGLVDWEKVYPGNMATSEVATIEDFALVYPDNSPSQANETYVPHYLIRGSALLSSGFTVKFSQALPALKNPDVAGVSTIAQAGKQLQIKTLQIPSPRGSSSVSNLASSIPSASSSITGNSSPIPVTLPSPTPELPLCFQSNIQSGGLSSSLIIRLSINGETYELRNNGAHGIYVYLTSTPRPDIVAIRQAFYDIVRDQYIINVAKWYRSKPERLNQVQSPQDIRNMFDEMNGIDSSFDCQYPLPSQAYITTVDAPLPQCGVGNENATAVNRITDEVAQAIFQAKGQGKIAELAGKPDLLYGNRLFNGDRGYLHWFLQPIDTGAGWTEETADAHACYISGTSPSIFVYSDSKIEITISPKSPLTYADPVIEAVGWTIITDRLGNINSPKSREYLYYEYDKSQVTFNQPPAGYVVASNTLPEFMTNLASKLGLNQKETAQLLREFNNEVKTDKKYLQIGIVPLSEIEEKLPLEIMPKPNNLKRLHFVVTPQDSYQNIPAPTINSIKRGGLTVIEFGVHSL